MFACCLRMCVIVSTWVSVCVCVSVHTQVVWHTWPSQECLPGSTVLTGTSVTEHDSCSTFKAISWSFSCVLWSAICVLQRESIIISIPKDCWHKQAGSTQQAGAVWISHGSLPWTVVWDTRWLVDYRFELWGISLSLAGNLLLGGRFAEVCHVEVLLGLLGHFSQTFIGCLPHGVS